jgi:hypothetical protein
MPNNVSDSQKNISIEYDKFENSTWIETPMYLSRKGFTDTFPVELKYRAFFKGEDLEFIQLYIAKTDVEWGFYNSGIGEDGTRLEFVTIDKNVDPSSGMVTVVEHFAFNINLNYLQKMAKKDWEIKVYGKRNEGVFTVSSALSEAFLSKLNCYKEKSCR